MKRVEIRKALITFRKILMVPINSLSLPSSTTPEHATHQTNTGRSYQRGFDSRSLFAPLIRRV